MVKINLTDAQIEAARKAGEAALNKEFHAAAAWYEIERDLVWIETTTGIYHGVPSERLQGLTGATPDQLADIEVSSQGTGIHWPQLDADLTVQGMLSGIYGSKAWMAELGKQGGKSKSLQKAIAARVNGQKGGRPKKNSAIASPIAEP